MFCPRCGDPIEVNERFCNKCGLPLNNNVSNNPVANVKPSNKKSIFLGLGVGLALVAIVFVIFLISSSGEEDYYFSGNSYADNEEVLTPAENKPKNKYSTVIVYDNVYEGVSITNEKDAFELIVKDSVSQKDACPKEIRAIEDEIISKYNITAVNLCEVDLGFAKEIANVFKVIYEEYPSARDGLTNLTLVNATMSNNYIAAFQPVFIFASDDYNAVIKTQVLLNTRYFLNTTMMESSVQSASNSGHFPKNANRYSPVAHELGHYLSYLAMLNYYKVDSFLLLNSSNQDKLLEVIEDFKNGAFSLIMIEEAYKNYKKEVGTNLSIDEWRGTISNYALAKDNEGNYIYDETIAEAFHDVYLNGDDAVDASKYVVEVLKDKLEG